MRNPGVDLKFSDINDYHSKLSPILSVLDVRKTEAWGTRSFSFIDHIACSQRRLKPHRSNFNLNKDLQEASQQLPCQVWEREKLNLLYLFQVSYVIGLIWELNFIFCLSKIRPTGDRMWKQLCEAILQMVGGNKELLMRICSFNKPREMTFDSPLYKW